MMSNRMLGLALALASAGPLPAAAQAGAAAPVDSLPAAALGPEDRTILSVAAAAVRAGPAVAALWPGYWRAEPEFVIRPFAGGALFVSPAAAAAPGARPLSAAATAGAAGLRGRAAWLPGAGIPHAFEMDYDVGGRTVMAASLFPMPHFDLEAATLVLLHHEAFHVFQRDSFAPLHGRPPLWQPDFDGRVLSAPDVRAAFAVERMVLAAALVEADTAARAAQVRTYLALRHERRALLPSDVAEAEAWLERMEGSAHLVGFEAALLTTEGGTARAKEIVLGELGHGAYDEGDADTFRSRMYATAAAMGLLLNDRAPGWRRGLQDGRSFATLLGEAFGFDTGTAATLAVAARQAFGHDSLLARFSAAGQPPDPLADFDDPRNPRLVLIGYDAGESSFMGPVSNAIPRTRVFLAGSALRLGGRAGQVTNTRNAAMDDRRQAPSRWLFILSGEVRVNGRPPTMEPERYPAIVLTADGLEVRLERPATVTWDGSTLTVTLEPGGR